MMHHMRNCRTSIVPWDLTCALESTWTLGPTWTLEPRLCAVPIVSSRTWSLTSVPCPALHVGCRLMVIRSMWPGCRP